MGVAVAALTGTTAHDHAVVRHASQPEAEPRGSSGLSVERRGKGELTFEDMGNAPGTRPWTSLGPALACAARAPRYETTELSAVLPEQDEVHTAMVVHDKHDRWRAFFGRGGPGQFFRDATSERLSEWWSPELHTNPVQRRLPRRRH